MRMDKITIAILCILGGVFIIGLISIIYSVVAQNGWLILRDGLVLASVMAILILDYIKKKLDE